MTRVDFYLLEQEGERDFALLACRLAEKAYLLGHRVYIHVSGVEQGAALDDLLWTFKSGSFIPHARLGVMDEPLPPVLVGHDAEPDTHHDVLINMTSEVPRFFSRFERVAELVSAAEPARAQARERYRFYKERGYTLDTHRLAGAGPGAAP